MKQVLIEHQQHLMIPVIEGQRYMTKEKAAYMVLDEVVHKKKI